MTTDEVSGRKNYPENAPGIELPIPAICEQSSAAFRVWKRVRDEDAERQVGHSRAEYGNEVSWVISGSYFSAFRV